MRLSCQQENLVKALGIVERAISSRSLLPVLGNVLVRAEHGGLRLAAANPAISITCRIDAQIEEEGATTVPARTFADLVGAFPKERVEMTLVPRTHTLHLACARTQANLRGMPVNEFPALPTLDAAAPALAVARAVLREALAQTVFAAATGDTRPILTGVHLRVEGTLATLAATDGYRLSVYTAPLRAGATEPVTLLVPAVALVEVARILASTRGGDEEDVLIQLPAGRDQILVRAGAVEIVSQLIEGNFPPYGQIVPQSHRTRAVLGVAEFRKACKTVDIFARESAHTARVRITPGVDGQAPGRLALTATSAETGDNVVELDAQVEGQAIEIAFNVHYLLELLGTLGDAQIALETTTPQSPGKLLPVGRENFLHVVMPMNIAH